MALDINSRNVGCAFGDADSPSPRCLTWKLPGCKDDDALTRSCASLYNSISELGKLIHPAFVLIEAPFNPQRGETNHQTVVNLFRLEGVARSAGANSGARVLPPVHAATWRKTFCGHGRPENPKLATQDRCRLLKWKFETEDEADACGIWAYGMSVRFPKWAPNSTPLFAGKAAAG